MHEVLDVSVWLQGVRPICQHPVGCQVICQHPVNYIIRGGAAVIVTCFKLEILLYHITFSLGNVSSIQLSDWSLQKLRQIELVL